MRALERVRGDGEPREDVGTLRAMCPEEPDDVAGPEPDDAPGGPPPDPLDRTWIHPAELSSFVAAPVAAPREVRPREWTIGIGSAIAGIVATVLVLVAFGALGGRHRSPVPPPVVTTPHDIIDFAVAERVAASVAPSIVTVRAGTDATQPVGSGVVIRSNRVITNAHLLSGATQIEVVTESGASITAKLLGTDPQTDLALLDVGGGQLALASFAATGLKVGQTVVAVGATRGTRYRLGINVVSDLDEMADTGTGVPVAGLIATGIPSNAEMAGGALVDANGNIAGILTYPATGATTLLAVSTSVLRDVEEQLDASGKVSHGWMGVVYGNDANTLPQGGATVQAVFPDSPAMHAGLQPGDVITRAGSQTVSGRADAIAASRSLRPHDPLDVVYRRDGRSHSANVTLGAGDPGQLPNWPTSG
jgi:S1-C subfamily serine protease